MAGEIPANVIVFANHDCGSGEVPALTYSSLYGDSISFHDYCHGLEVLTSCYIDLSLISNY